MSLAEKLQAEAQAERQLSSALREYDRVWRYVNLYQRWADDMLTLTEASARVRRFEGARGLAYVRTTLDPADPNCLPELARRGELTHLADRVDEVGAIQAYERFRANSLDNPDESR